MDALQAKTIDILYPQYLAWLKAQGWDDAQGKHRLKLWYEFLDWAKGVKDA